MFLVKEPNRSIQSFEQDLLIVDPTPKEMGTLEQGESMKIILLSLSPDIALYSLTFLSA